MTVRQATASDIPALAAIRAQSWGTEEYWVNRISGYLQSTKNPKDARKNRRIFAAIEQNEIVGLVAGHLTERFGCQGELQWINVLDEYQGKQIATKLLKHMAGWFLEQKALHICVNVEPDNIKGIHFYQKNGAVRMDDHWMVWKDISKAI